MRRASILIVDDEEGIRHGLESFFRREGFTVHCASGYDDAVSAATRHPVDLALVDIRLRTPKSGMDLLLELKRAEPDVIVVMITGYGSIDSAVSALKAGAADYLVKPVDNRKLLEVVSTNLQLEALKHENRFLKDELSRRSLPHHFVTQDPGLRQLLEKADKVKDSPITVLITGESGTGKEVLARYIHFTGPRRSASFVGINCAALSETLLLSELFGHERGAFTGAVERKRGKFELADGGTLFLDEVGDMSLETQAKLLRVIEESSFQRVGGVKDISVDARIVAATNKDLHALIRGGLFREDLFYRLDVVSFHLTPLRERRADIPLLLEHFLSKFSERYGREPPALSPETRAALVAYDWPGNVRELENAINQLVILGESSFVAAGVAALTERPAAHRPPASSPTERAGDAKPGSLKDAVGSLVAEQEKQIIAGCLKRNGGNKSRTARELSITRRTLALKLARYGLG